jgi:hypothetical protein
VRAELFANFISGFLENHIDTNCQPQFFFSVFFGDAAPSLISVAPKPLMLYPVFIRQGWKRDHFF